MLHALQVVEVVSASSLPVNLYLRRQCARYAMPVLDAGTEPPERFCESAIGLLARKP